MTATFIRLYKNFLLSFCLCFRAFSIALVSLVRCCHSAQMFKNTDDTPPTFVNVMRVYSWKETCMFKVK